MHAYKLWASAAFVIAAAWPVAARAAIPLMLSPSGPAMLSGSFERDVSGLFVDTFSFTPSALSGDVAVSLAPLDGTINFSSALLNGQAFSFLPEAGSTTFEFTASVGVDTPLSLTVLGFSGDAETLAGAAGRYRGSIVVDNITAVIPEPQTTALMLFGLAGMAGLRATSRSRRRPA